MTKLAALTAAITLTVVLLTGAAAQTIVNTVLTGHSAPSSTATADIPPDYLTLYQQAAAHCPGLDWAILAAIGKVESDHGRSRLPGVRSGGNPQAHAMGPMQIIPSTWASILARHKIPPGGSTPPSPYHPHDAAHAAALLLCGNNITHDLRGAIFAYNHADWYVNEVLALADAYRAAPATTPADVRLDWPPERATVPDPTSSGRLTPRTHTLLRALQQRDLTGNGIVCWAPRPANPRSLHPQGRACDIFFDPHDPASVAEGWRVANWLIKHQAIYGTSSIIWQGRYWSAADPRWGTYHSEIYNCPDKSNLTGCHYDHLHWDTA